MGIGSWGIPWTELQSSYYSRVLIEKLIVAELGEEFHLVFLSLWGLMSFSAGHESAIVFRTIRFQEKSIDSTCYVVHRFYKHRVVCGFCYDLTYFTPGLYNVWNYTIRNFTQIPLWIHCRNSSKRIVLQWMFHKGIYSCRLQVLSFVTYTYDTCER